MRGSWPLLLALLACRDGCSCRPDIEPPDTRDDTGDTDTDTDPDTADTGPAPPCDAPEAEPNGSPSTATPLPLERQGCGEFSEPLDLDFWTLSLDEPTWLGVRVEARSLGSYAHPQLVLSSDGGESATIGSDRGDADAWLVFPAPAGAWSLLLTDDAGQGDPVNYFYEVLAGEEKEPVSWTVSEAANESIGAAQDLAHGDAVFGDLSDRMDQDWYRIRVPAGKHAVEVDVDAADAGSAADLALLLYQGEDPEDATLTGRHPTGEDGHGLDPWFELSSAGDEDLWIRVDEQDGRSGVAYWYLLTVRLEAS